MFGPHQPIDYSDLEVGSYQDGIRRRSRQNSVQTVGRGSRAVAKKRSSRKRTGPPITGISHRRNRKWTW
jgi:hypothetical protein